jgi:hypothetical protein
MKTYALYTLIFEGRKKPKLRQIAEKLHIVETDLDPEFGVVLIDPDKQQYCIMIDAEVLKKIDPDSEIQGPFSNPRIEPMDPR